MQSEEQVKRDETESARLLEEEVMIEKREEIRRAKDTLKRKEGLVSL